VSGLTQTATAADGTRYRDLNKNGVMDLYEDPRQPVTVRVRDLLSRMSLAEKVGELFQPKLEIGPDGSLVEETIFLPHGTTHAIEVMHITNVYAMLPPEDPAATARWHNQLQRVAERTRLGIPVLVSSDPVHAKADNIETGLRASGFSLWPDSLGLAALHDPEAAREFGEYARREYLAVGFRRAVHPQIDLATDPRWARQSQTFGADAELSSRCTRAYIEAFQLTTKRGEPLGHTSVSCIAKHFPGGGAQKDGEDPHFPYGREQVYPAGLFEYHLRPFVEAIETGVAEVMPYYSLPEGLEYKGRVIESVGFGFNKQILTGLLREDLGFEGVISSDHGIISPYEVRGFEVAQARAWGVEDLDRGQRIAKALDAGMDQFGGEQCTDILLALVDQGIVTEQRLDESVARLLRVKFELGLFDDPYVDELPTDEIVGDSSSVEAGFRTQIASLVLLEDAKVLPLPGSPKLYVEGAEAASFDDVGVVVGHPEEADYIVLRLPAPFEPRTQFLLESGFHAGSLEFSDETVEHVRTLAEAAPVIIDVKLERPAVLTPLVGLATVLIGSFGSSDRALARALRDPASMRGRLPFDVPRSMATVERSCPDAPFDLDDVLYRHGYSRNAVDV
jgi:beta-glucosidase